MLGFVLASGARRPQAEGESDRRKPKVSRRDRSEAEFRKGAVFRRKIPADSYGARKLTATLKPASTADLRLGADDLSPEIVDNSAPCFPTGPATSGTSTGSFATGAPSTQRPGCAITAKSQPKKNAFTKKASMLRRFGCCVGRYLTRKTRRQKCAGDPIQHS